jgi:hypothetical protein
VLVGLCMAGATAADASGATPPLVGAIRWDAWHPLNATYPTQYVTPKLYDDWPTREPLQGWYLYGDGIDTQALVDQEIDWAADHGIDYWAFVWYRQTPGEITSQLMRPFNAYLSAPNKDRLRFAFIMQTSWVADDGGEPGWRSTFVPELVKDFRDPQYVRVNGNRPVIYWFGSNQLETQPLGFGADWQAQLDYLRDRTRGQLDETGRPLGEPLFIDVNHDVGAAQSHRFDGVASYGPSGARPPTASGCPDPQARSWAAQAAQDVANLSVPAPLLTVPSPTPVNDPRPRDSDPDYVRRAGLPGGYGFWSQPPTYGQWERHFQALYDWARDNPAKTTDPALLLTYAWNELDEGGGGIVPTRQDQFKYLDGIRAVTTGDYPGSYVDTYNGDNCSIRFTGTGWIRYPRVGTAYDSDVQISWTPGDTATLTTDEAVAFRVRFNKGPDRGKVDISIDGRPPTAVNLYSPDYRWWDYTSGALARGRHTISIAVRADRDPSARGNQVPIDRLDAQIQRAAAWEFDGADSEGWSADYQASASVSGGALHLTATGPDAQLYNPAWGSSRSLGLAAGPNRYVHIRMRNNTDSTSGRLYFRTDADQQWDGAKSKAFPIVAHSGYVEYVVDMRTVPGWHGTIRTLRLDAGDPTIAGGSYDIDFIRTADAG